ncbi:ABC transporter ATP-binding protein [Mesorhizobium sp. WSM4887]|uniref:dipeptide ABC transporter ATP-binding protein n=1 Tax=Mesorhizobium sp. WSM4887 TaxID=3038543 RepID=UPI002417BD2D|nr:ABC transporter ATP-binding protein [Mesorhizobium sp. WSM4887]MDG4889787.1 ABC transporter ATP-binding protein [Mesorhizobium sp. WSM4887]
MSVLLDVRDLVTEMPTQRGVLTVTDGVSFAIEPGECLGIVGESGSGKSMTCRSILGLVPYPGKTTGGEVLYGGADLRKLSGRELNKLRGTEIAMIVQDSIAALNPVRRIGDQITEAMLKHGMVPTRAVARERAIDLMRKVGIPAPETRLDDYPHQFSGGMCQRVVIASALACSPKIILADEPTTALDVTIQDQILKLLVQLQQDLGLSLVLVTHDMSVVAHTSQRVAVMYAGQIVELADTRTLFRSPRHPYTLGLINCTPRIDADGEISRLRPIPGTPPDLLNPPDGCRFHPRCPLAGPECMSGSFPLRQIAGGHLTSCIRHEQLAAAGNIWPTDSGEDDACQSQPASVTVAAPPGADTPLLEVRNLTKVYAGPKSLLSRLTGRLPQQLSAVDDVSFDIKTREILGIVGESGSGKTTLGRSLLRLVEPSQGAVLFRGDDILKYSGPRLMAARRNLQMIFQDPYSSLNPRLTVRRMLSEVLSVHRVCSPAGIEARVLELLSLVGLPANVMERHPRHFSGGQRQRLGIARALAVEPSFIVADEPVSAVDVSVQAQIMNLLLDLRDRLGLTMLFIAHDLSVVQYVSNRVGVMYLGRIVEIAPTEQLFGAPRHPYTQGLLRAAPRPDPDYPSAQVAILGEPPSPLRPPPGCRFNTRCHLATDICRLAVPPLKDVGGGHQVACHHLDKTIARLAESTLPPQLQHA